MDQKFDFHRNDFYLHYPLKRPQLVAFGNQDKSRLGTGKSTGDILYMNINMPNKIQVKEVTARKNFTMVITL